MRPLTLIALAIGLPFASVAIANGDLPAKGESSNRPKKSVRADAHGDPLPAGALARLGTRRWRLREVPLVFSPNGQHIILVGRPTTLLVDPLTGKVARKFDVESGQAFFMADNRTVMLAGGADAKAAMLRFLDVQTGRIVRQITIDGFDGGFLRGFWQASWSADGAVVACMQYIPFLGPNLPRPYNWRFGILNTDSGKMIGQWQSNAEPVRLAPDGKTLIVRDKSQMTFLDVAGGKELRRWKDWFTFSPDGKQLAAVKGGNITVWDLGNASPVLKKELRPLVSTAKNEPVVLAFSRDGRYLAAAGSTGSLYLWDLTSDKLMFNQSSAGHGRPIYLLSFSPNGKTLFTHATYLPSVRLWEIPNGKELSPADANAGVIGRLAFSPDSKTIASIGLDPPSLWNARAGRLVRRFEHFYGSGNDGLVFQPSGASLATRLEHLLAIFNVDDGKTLYRSPGPPFTP